MDEFVNLHLHSCASLQDSIIRIPDLVNKVQEYGQTAVAVTDHSSCASWIELNNECNANKKNNQVIKPIFGNEFYCIPKYVKGSRRRDHLVLLAMNQTGLVNIRKLQRIAVEHSYYKPLLSYELLEANNHEGIYCTSACSLSSISKCILHDNINEAINYAEYFNDLFDGNFALELQFHPDYKEQSIINEKLVEISDKLDIPLTVSCDSHFVDENDRDLRKIVQAISWNKLYSDESLYDSLKSNCIGNSELVKQFAVESNFQYMHVVSSAIKQTQKIAQMCNAQIESPERRIPVFDKYDELNELFEVVEW